MERKVNFTLMIVFLFCLVLPGGGLATEILPTSYSFTPTTGQTGMWTYDDPSFSKLTDGTYGVDNWTFSHDAWVGWWGIEHDGTLDGDGNPIVTNDHYSARSIELEFSFDSGVSISSLVLGTNQDAINSWNVVFPSYIEVKFGDTQLGSRVTPFDPGNSGYANGLNNGKRHDVIFNFDEIMMTDEDNMITLILNNQYNFEHYEDYGIPWDNSPGSSNNGMFWIFLDEVDFDSKPVPIPPTILLLGLSLPAVIAFGRKRRLS